MRARLYGMPQHLVGERATRMHRDDQITLMKRHIRDARIEALHTSCKSWPCRNQRRFNPCGTQRTHRIHGEGFW